MANVFKTFLADDTTTTKTLLHEAIPITGSIISGTYPEPGLAGSNIKTYGHGMFESVYDYPYLSSSANHIFDMSVGLHSISSYYDPLDAWGSKKLRMYNQMAQVLAGYDIDGNILQFDADGDFADADLLEKYTEAYFITFSRLLTKDEIKKGSFSMELGMSLWEDNEPCSERLTIADTNANSDYRVNSPAGEYGILYGSGGAFDASADSKVGLIYYQAGVVVLTASIFQVYDAVTSPGGKLTDSVSGYAIHDPDWIVGYSGSIAGTSSFGEMLTGSSITGSCDGIRHRTCNIQFNNTTELNSTIYFCRINHNDFNYSSNPTYLNGSQIRVKEVSQDIPISYITGIGLYSADNELLGFAKLSEPLKKDSSNSIVLRVRTDW